MANYLRPFSHLSTRDLCNLMLMSKIASCPNLVASSEQLLNIASRAVGVDAVSYYLGQTILSIFSAGEDLASLDRTLKILRGMNQGSIVGYCAEDESTDEEMIKNMQAIEGSLLLGSTHQSFVISIKISSLIPKEVLKKANKIQSSLSTPETVWTKSIFSNVSSTELSALGFSLEESNQIQTCMERCRRLCKLAQDFNIKLLVDAEQSYLQLAIDAIAATLQEEFNTKSGLILNTFQSYLKNSSVKLKSYLDWSTDIKKPTALKLVRGAYMIEERNLVGNVIADSPVHDCKDNTNESYNRNLQLALSYHGKNSSLCVASHNDDSVEIAKELMWNYRIHRQLGGVFFGQLLGMKSIISRKLVEENYIVRKYVPFGPVNKFVPYIVRRTQEQGTMIGDMQLQISQIIEEFKIRGEKVDK